MNRQISKLAINFNKLFKIVHLSFRLTRKISWWSTKHFQRRQAPFAYCKFLTILKTHIWILCFAHRMYSCPVMYQSLCPTNALCPRFCFDPAHTTSVDIDFNRGRPANELPESTSFRECACSPVANFPDLIMNSETGTSPETVRIPVRSLGNMCLIAVSLQKWLH